MPFINSDEPTRSFYEFNNGVKKVAKDPSVVWRTLNAACVRPGADGTPGETWDALMDKWRLCGYSDDTPIAEKLQKIAAFRIVQEKLAAAAREAFDLQPLDDDGNGVTEEFVMDVLMEFIGAREKKEPTPATSPSASPPAVSAPATTSNAPSGGRGRHRTNMGSSSTTSSPSR